MRAVKVQGFMWPELLTRSMGGVGLEAWPQTIVLPGCTVLLSEGGGMKGGTVSSTGSSYS